MGAVETTHVGSLAVLLGNSMPGRGVWPAASAGRADFFQSASSRPVCGTGHIAGRPAPRRPSFGTAVELVASLSATDE